MVFEGAFEKIFSLIKEEGGSDGGVVVQVILFDLFFSYLIRCVTCLSVVADKPLVKLPSTY